MRARILWLLIGAALCGSLSCLGAEKVWVHPQLAEDEEGFELVFPEWCGGCQVDGYSKNGKHTKLILPSGWHVIETIIANQYETSRHQFIFKLSGDVVLEGKGWLDALLGTEDEHYNLDSRAR